MRIEFKSATNFTIDNLAPGYIFYYDQCYYYVNNEQEFQPILRNGNLGSPSTRENLKNKNLEVAFIGKVRFYDREPT